MSIPAISIQPDGATLQAFLADRGRAKFLQGPVGSAKTTNVIHSLMVNAIMLQVPANGEMGTVKGTRHRRTLVIRNSYKQIIDTVLPSVRMHMPEAIWGPITLSGRPRRMIRLPGLEWEWLFYAADKPDDVQDLKSLELSDAWVSEYRYSPREIVSTLQERVGRYPPLAAGGCTYPQVLGETNAPTEGHWSAVMSGQQPVPEGLSEADRLALVKPTTWSFYIQPPGVLEVRNTEGRVSGYVPNPAAENLKNLPPNYYADAVAGRTPEDIQTELLNRPGRTRTGKAVWASYKEDTHKAKGQLLPVPNIVITVGVDFGRTPAAIFGQQVFGQWRILGEFWADNMGAKQFAGLLKGFMAQRFPGANFAMFGDPAGDHLAEADDISPMRMFRAAGLRIIPAPTNDVSIRLNAVAEMFNRLVEGAPGILVSDNCQALLSALGGGYMYRKMATSGDVYSEVPDKNRHSHIADALQYMAIGGGEGRALLTTVGPQHRPQQMGHNGGPSMGQRREPGRIVQPAWRGRGWSGIGRQ